MRWVRHVARIVKRVMVGKLEERDCFEVLCLYGSIMLRGALK